MVVPPAAVAAEFEDLLSAEIRLRADEWAGRPGAAEWERRSPGSAAPLPLGAARPQGEAARLPERQPPFSREPHGALAALARLPQAPRKSLRSRRSPAPFRVPGRVHRIRTAGAA